MVENTKFAGDVSIDKVNIISSKGFFQDVTAQVQTVQYFEDIFSPFITGSLIIKDSLDLVNLFPFVGEEMVEIEISTPGIETKISGKYYIYKMTDRELIGDRQVLYKLHFISPEAIVDVNKKISKVYSGKISDIVEPLMTSKLDGLETTKPFSIEPTANRNKFLSPFWTPTKIIKYCAENAISQSNAPDYVFFENRYGFAFISLGSLYSGAVKQEFTYDNYTRDSNGSGGDARNIAADYTRIKEFNIPLSFDYIDRISSGMLSSRIHSFDSTKKTYTAKNFNIFQNFDQRNHLNPNPLNSSGVKFKNNSLIMNYPRMTQAFNAYLDTSNFKTIQERTALLKIARANTMEMSVFGRTDYTVGQKVKVKLNKVEPISNRDTDIQDNMHSGYYLISAINHVITRESHECNMEIMKETLQTNPNIGGSVR